MKKPLNSNALKYIAIIAMLIDHIAWAFVPLLSVSGQIMHFIGRFTAPIMCYFIAEGYFHTKDIRKYILRIGIFAIISQIPFVIAEKLTSPPVMMIDGKLWINPELLIPSFNVMFTLMLGLVALLLWNIKIIEKPLRIMIVISLCFISLSGDWMCFSVLWILFFGIYRNDNKRKWVSYYCIALSSMTIVITTNILGGLPLWHNFWQLGLLFPPIILHFYNGKKGSKNPFNKWFFYIFYPLHLLIIGIIKFYI
ncbi:MAG: hypothetical protein IKK32_05675 [Oscillospiraceae bacterium]|nr:hypothetical protein [Oscillospiraceae bacterium]